MFPSFSSNIYISALLTERFLINLVLSLLNDNPGSELSASYRGKYMPRIPKEINK